jgi:starvation-inducible outer membrane lipoprotein
MIHNNRIFQFLTAVLGSTILLGTACTKIPQEGSIAPDITYKNRKQYAISGLQLNIGSFQSSTSTLPLKFEIMEIREPGGKPVSALTDEIPVIRYKEAITGNESAAELALKSDTVMVPAVSINEYTGVLEIQEGNKIPAGEYHFDIQVSNQSGSKLLTDALVVEFKEQDVISWSSGMAKQPEIERVGDAPNQIRFVAYLDGQPLPGDYIDFTKDRAAGFKGTFVDDTDDGEIWNVNFPVKEADTYATWKVVTEVGGVEQVSYESYNFDFVIGIPGSYVVRLYK